LLAPHNKIKVPSKKSAANFGRFSLGDEKAIAQPPRGPALIGVSDPMAILPNERNKNCDHSNCNEHPVLAFETQKGKMFNKELQRFCSPIF
jgi:hypothetical protein